MINKFKFIFNMMKNYDKKATNPFVENNFKYNNDLSLYEKTYIWVEKTNGKI